MTTFQSAFRRARLAAVLSLVVLSASAFAQSAADDDANFDRMDGTGASGKTVNVIEWEGNLEIHVAPPGGLKGLALKLDRTNKSKPVMVIGYRFDTNPSRQLIRRAILGIDLRDGFRVYRDKSVAEYDKIVITNNTLSGSDLVAYRLDPELKQLYPDGSPMLANQKSPADSRAPASTDTVVNTDPATANVSKKKKARAARQRLQDDGTIAPFFGGGGSGGQQAGQVAPADSDQ